QRIDLEILRLGIFADDHALVELFAGADEQHAAVLQRVQRVSHRLALLHRDQHAVLPPADRALVGAVAFEQAVHDPGAAGVGQELAMIPDQAAARRAEGDAGLTAARWAHVGHLAFAQRDLLDDGAGEFFVHVHNDRLVRLLAAVGTIAEQHTRPADRQLEAFAAHVLDQHAELVLAAACDFERVLAGALGYPNGNVGFRLPLQPVAEHAALHLVALAPRIGTVVDAEGHRQRRRIDRLGSDRHADVRVGD